MAEEVAAGELLRELIVANSPQQFCRGLSIIPIVALSHLILQIAVRERYHLLFNPRIVATIPVKKDAANKPTKARAV